MKLKVAIALGLLLAGTNSAADEDVYKALCIEEKSTGFKWKDGAWHNTSFTPRKFLIVKKKTYLDESKNPVGCRDLDAVMPLLGSLDMVFGILEKGCYNIREFGELPPVSNVCTEVRHINLSGGEKPLSKIGCTGPDSRFYFLPNGHFHSAWIHGGLGTSPKIETKDSLAVSVGTCSIL